jgi:hypothetical protein
MPCDTPGGRALSADEHVTPELRLAAVMDEKAGPLPRPCPGDLDFTHPDFALLAGRTGLADGARSFFYLSTNRCRRWQGPFDLPTFGLRGVAARSDFIVLGPRDGMFLLTAAKPDGSEGEVFCARTRDGGAGFEFVSHIGPRLVHPGWRIMPASVRLPGGEVLTALRCGEPTTGDAPWRHWIDLYRSGDKGSTWQYAGRPVPDTGINGNPPTLTRLGDGRLVITYGYRNEPRGIFAVYSTDDGGSWSDPIGLRLGAGAADLGYPRTTVMSDGTLVTAYYFADQPFGERYIAATRWTLPHAEPLPRKETSR